MSLNPIVEHHRADPPAALRKSVDRLARDLLRERPDLAADAMFRPLVPRNVEDGPALHLDDLSEIPLLEPWREISYMQDRARLRAGDGDFVASCAPAVPGYEDYCREFLGLGSPQWLLPADPDDRLQVAAACWRDQSTRERLLEALRRRELSYLHPHVGSLPAWELAALLHQESRRPLKVIAPPPGLAKWANDKVAFAETVERLFGSPFVPRTEHAANFAKLSELVHDLAGETRVVTLKLPDSAGGGGNIVLEAEHFRGRSLHDIHDVLKDRFRGLAWSGESELLVGVWETDVCSAPSAQLWIPPERQGEPVIEGLFVQEFEGDAGIFVGNRPAAFSETLQRELIDRCWLLGRLLQRLGYVGRCSFDMLLVGETPEQSRPEFIECNGRWGGTSVPMMLMNRLFGDWTRQPYAVRDYAVPGLDKLGFEALLEALGGDLYDTRTAEGRIIVANPGRLPTRSGLTLFALADSWDEAARIVHREFPERLRGIAESAQGTGSR